MSWHRGFFSQRIGNSHAWIRLFTTRTCSHRCRCHGAESVDFADCVLNREQPIASLNSGIRSDIISHMGDICVRTGETLGWDPVKETIIGSDDAVAMMHRPMRAPWTL